MNENRIYNSGDSLVITIKPKQKGTAIITSYTDDVVFYDKDGNVKKFSSLYSAALKREYRLVENGLFYSDWTRFYLISGSGVINLKIKQNNYIQIRYTDVTDSISDGSYFEFHSITFNGDFQPEVVISPILDKSIFSSIAWTDETELLTKNLFKKLYFRGIIPTYIQRGDNLSVDEDRDYIDLFYSIARYFAIIFRFFKRFENFYNDKELMLEWLRQNEIQFDESSITLTQMQFLARHFYDEIRKRGTVMVFKRQGDVVNGEELEIDGEFIRLIRSKRSDELLYENIPLYKLGWCLMQSSPLYRGTAFAKNLNKTKEEGEDFESLDNYQHFANKNSSVSIQQVDVVYNSAIVDTVAFEKLTNGQLSSEKVTTPVLAKSQTVIKDLSTTANFSESIGNISKWTVVSADTVKGLTTIQKITSSKKVLYCKTTGNSACGLGRYDESTDVSENLYVADPNMDYEITFMFNVQLAGNDAKIHFGVEGFDILKNKLNDAFITSDGDKVTGMFLDGLELSHFKENQWYFVRGIIHAYSSRYVDNALLNIGFGSNLNFDNRFLKYIMPKIYLSSANSSSMYIWNYKIRPLVRGTNILSLKNGTENSHSLGFIQAPQIFYAYFRNNNNSQSESDITDIIERYLLPFNMTDILQFIDND